MRSPCRTRRAQSVAGKGRAGRPTVLPGVLDAVADNTTAVWDWAPQGTPVRGCLVLGGERRPAPTRYDYGKGPVVVHTPATLARELKAEAVLPRELDERVADAVAELGPVSG